MLSRPVAGVIGLLGALAAGGQSMGIAWADDEIVDSVAGVIDGDGPMVAGQTPPSAHRPKYKNRRAAPDSLTRPIWEQDGPAIDRAGVDGR